MRLLLPIFFTILTCNWCDGLRILGLFPLNGKSHWVMAEQLMISLAERGHQVDVVTHFSIKNPPSNYREISLEGSLEPVVNNLNASSLGPIQTNDMKHLVTMAGNKTCGLLSHPKLQKLIKNPPKDPPYDIVVVELFIAPCFLGFGRIMNVPMVGMMTCSFHDWLSDLLGNPHNPAFTPSVFAPYGQRMTFWERLMNTYITNAISLSLNYELRKQVDYVKEYFNIDTEIEDLYSGIAAILVNSHHSINGVNPMTQGIIEIGGLHVKENSDPLTPELQKWLDESKHGCIFFTFGSMMRIESFPKPLIETFYKVFEQIAPIRVLMKVARKEDLLPGLPKNVMIQSWFPQVSVFKHKNIKAFLTHGGLMGTHEAIYHGIPMIGIPLFGDQSMNLNNAANKKIGVNIGSVENVTVETLSNAINAVLHDETYRTNMQRISRLFKDRPLSPVDTAIYWIEYVSRNGYVLQSPAMHLHWWQQRLWDVYGFVFACLAIILYVTIFILKKLKNCLFGCKSYCKKEKPSTESKKRK